MPLKSGFLSRKMAFYSEINRKKQNSGLDRGLYQASQKFALSKLAYCDDFRIFGYDFWNVFSVSTSTVLQTSVTVLFETTVNILYSRVFEMPIFSKKTLFYRVTQNKKAIFELFSSQFRRKTLLHRDSTIQDFDCMTIRQCKCNDYNL